MMRKYLTAVPLAGLFLAGAQMAYAHAILVRSTPVDRSVIHSRNVDLILDYNSRIEGSRCTVTLTGPAGNDLPVRRQASTKPYELKAEARDLVDGAYRIHWQVLASDGHITRGDIAFTVAAK